MLENEEIWQEMIEVLKEFGYIDNDDIFSEKNQNFIWEIIINIKEHLKEDIVQAIRINLKLCYLLEINDENKIKKVNSDLFKINYIFDQDIYRFDNPADKGLKIFYKTLNSTYGNVKAFISSFKLVKENLSFIRKRHDFILINSYNYLKKISLPLRGYEELRIALLTLLEKYKEIKPLLYNPNTFNSFSKEIDEFIEEYHSVYLQEHNHFHESLKDFYQNLYALQEYKALECLSKIQVINVAYNLKPIQKYIITFFPEECQNYNIKETLEKNTKCNCGFTLGDSITIPSLNKIKPMLRKGIMEYIKKIQNERFQSLFENYLFYNKNSIIRNFLEFKADKINGNLRYINNQLIEEINKALSNTYPLKISIDEIAANLSGTYPANHLELLTEELKESLKLIIKNKTKGIDKNNFDDIIINIEY
ncbi:MAG: hypothetical protein ACOCRK_03915 [bacterium]